jgi:hypothetical protein
VGVVGCPVSNLFVCRELPGSGSFQLKREIMKLNLSGHFNKTLEGQGFIFPGALHVDLQDPQLPEKVANFLGQIEGLDGSEPVIVALPGLAPLAAIVLAVIHGMTGNFPIVQPLVRTDEGFVPGSVMDLQGIRNDLVRAKHRANAIVL